MTATALLCSESGKNQLLYCRLSVGLTGSNPYSSSSLVDSFSSVFHSVLKTTNKY